MLDDEIFRFAQDDKQESLRMTRGRCSGGQARVDRDDTRELFRL